MNKLTLIQPYTTISLKFNSTLLLKLCNPKTLHKTVQY